MAREVQSTWIEKEAKEILIRFSEKLGEKSATKLASSILESWARAMMTGKKGRIWFNDSVDRKLKTEIQSYYNGDKPKLPKEVVIRKSNTPGTFIICNANDETKQYGFIVNSEKR